MPSVNNDLSFPSTKITSNQSIMDEQCEEQLHIGILEIQGGFSEHKAALIKAAQLMGNEAMLKIYSVRKAEDLLSKLCGLIIPGGESTTMGLFITRNKMADALQDWIKDEKHIAWGTCAGLIMLANQSEKQKIGGQSLIGGLDIVVSRNYFGRQVNSFQGKVKIVDKSLLKENTPSYFEGVFIRAPAVVKVNSPEVSTLAVLPHSSKEKSDTIVAVKQKNIIGTAFHPELTEDLRWHEYFLKIVLSVQNH
ncbi:probable pyridoxal 5'-phosphate synthase subunit PDX2 [Octopus sinensis]|uniref:glutaminase n=1 Tax=Octopus sinensis TaxID=2607531 RepID=A0A6P7U226_9MOLL|nr:probable pyridoxal 5'-phosphate synthase subunit PDX2 [Octopus sinensis]